jgi:hypothetical protein
MFDDMKCGVVDDVMVVAVVTAWLMWWCELDGMGLRG